MTLSPYPTLRLRVTPEPSLKVKVIGAVPMGSDISAGTVGLLARNSSGVVFGRTLTPDDGNITITDGDGLLGNPRIGLADEIEVEGARVTDLLLVSTAESEIQVGGSTLHAVIGAVEDDDGLLIAAFDGAAHVRFVNSSSGEWNTFGLLANDVSIGSIQWYQSGTDDYHESAMMRVAVDGTPNTDDSPARFEWWTTPDGGANWEERMRLDNQGKLIVSEDPSTGHINAGGTRARVQIAHTDEDDAGLSVIAYGFNDAAPGLRFARTDSALPNQHTLIGADEQAFYLKVFASDGVDFRELASLEAFTGNSPSAGDMPGTWIFSTTPEGSTSPVERWRITSAGRLVARVGGGGTVGFDQGTPQFQVLGDGADTAAIGLARYGNDSNPARIEIGKSRGSVGTHAVLNDGDDIFDIRGESSDGGDFDTSVILRAESDGGSSADVTPGRFSILLTPQGSNSAETKFRLDSGGILVIGNTPNGVGAVGGTQLAVIRDDSSTNTELELLRLRRTTSGTAANGIGAAIKFELENGSGSNIIGIELAAVTTDVTAGSEDYDYLIRTRAAGTLTERLRLSSVGDLRLSDGGHGSPGYTPQIHLARSSQPVILLEDEGTGSGGLTQGATTTLYGEGNVSIKTGVGFSSSGPGANGTTRITIENSSGNIYFHDNLIALKTPSDANHGIIYEGGGIDGMQFRGFAAFTWKTGSAAATEQFRYVAANKCLDLNIGNNFISTEGMTRVGTQFDKTSDTTLANVTNLTSACKSGRFYSFRAVLFTTSNSAGGVKASVDYSAAVTSYRAEGWLINGNTVAGQTRTTTDGSAMAAVTAVTAAVIFIEGTIQTNADGNLTVTFAQNVSNGTASSVLTGSYFEVWDTTPN